MFTRRIGALLGILVLALLIPFVGSADEVYECYLPVRIIGAGTAAVNGQAFFAGFADERPYYIGRDARVEWDSGTRRWIIFDTSGGSDVLAYTNSDNDLTPPDRGWDVLGGVAPDPRLDGGGACPIIEPTGIDGSFLDRGLDLREGDAPPSAGERSLAAVYTVGEVVTGGCHLLDPKGGRYVTSYVHVYVYAVDIVPAPNQIRIVTHWIALHDWDTGEYVIEWHTTDQAPGFYDLHLAFEGGGYETMRIELVAAQD